MPGHAPDRICRRDRAEAHRHLRPARGFTPTCSAKHVPGYVVHLADLKVKNVDEVWCVSLNDGYVGRLGREQKAIGKVRMLETATGDQEARPRG